MPIDLVRRLKKTTPKRGLSRFLTDAAMEKIEKIEKEKTLKELLAAPPAFTDIEDPASYIRKERKLDEKRLKRLGL